MRLHLLEIYRGPESGVETPSVFPIIGSHLKSLFFFLRGNHLESSNHKSWVCGVAGIPGPRMGKMQFVWLYVCLELGRESYSRNITGSKVCTAPMSRWLPKLEYGNVGSLLKAEGHCLGGCDDICSSLWPLCGANYINAANSDTHTHTNSCDPSFTWWSCFLLTDTHWLSQLFSFSYKVKM